MKKQRTFYFRSIARRWQREIGEGGSNLDVSVYSPYLTSKTAEVVIGGASPQRCKIYTRFSVEDFAAGASSLKCLRKLCTLGYSIFSVPSLHAKVIVVPGRFASIGSQNLTSGGTHNREASVVFTDPKEVAQIEVLAAGLKTGASKITQEMIADLEDGMRAIERKFKEARQAAREFERIAQQKSAQRAQERMRQFRAAVNRLARGSSNVTARVTQPSQRLVYRWGFPEGYDPPTTLLAGQNHDLTRWEVNGKFVRLWETYRYLCLDMQHCRIGWARVVKRRISFVADGIGKMKATFAGQVCNLEVSATRNPEEIGKHNLKVKLSITGRIGKLEVQTWLTLEGLSVVGITLSENASAVLQELKDWLSDNEESFAAEVLQKVVPSFRYQSKLFGDHADKFFGPVGTRRSLRVQEVDGSPVLVVA